MKKRIIKKKENRRIKENTLRHIRKNDKNYSYLKDIDYLKDVNVEWLIDYRYLYINNRRSLHGLPKKDFKKFHRDAVRASILYNNYINNKGDGCW